jgi:hypothetical protein
MTVKHQYIAEYILPISPSEKDRESEALKRKVENANIWTRYVIILVDDGNDCSLELLAIFSAE